MADSFDKLEKKVNPEIAQFELSDILLPNQEGDVRATLCRVEIGILQMLTQVPLPVLIKKRLSANWHICRFNTFTNLNLSAIERTPFQQPSATPVDEKPGRLLKKITNYHRQPIYNNVVMRLTEHCLQNNCISKTKWHLGQGLSTNPNFKERGKCFTMLNHKCAGCESSFI